MNIEIIISFFVTLVLSLCIVPVVNQVGQKLNIIAHINNRTVHTSKISRIGGYGIYISFLIGVIVFLKTDQQINAILIGGFIIFMIGLYDDMCEISPKLKLIAQLIASLVVVFYGGIELKGLPISNLSWLITIVWIIGITNAINLIDGLDGLAAGISIIVLVTISFTSFISGRSDIASLSMVLAGATSGFLRYNFHPALIFMGDCGALFLGFMIAVISLLGFGYNASVFFTLGAPIVVLMVPILDTLIAIIRRKLSHRSFSEADRKHLHHRLMFKLKLGHTKSVLVLYTITILFSLTSFLYLYDASLGIGLFIFLMISFEFFVEKTDMINRKYKPLLTVLNIFLNHDDLPKIKAIVKYRNFRNQRKLIKLAEYILIILTCIVLSIQYIPKTIENLEDPLIDEPKITYIKYDEMTKEIQSLYDQLHKSQDIQVQAKALALYFLYGYESGETSQALQLLHPSIIADFSQYQNNNLNSKNEIENLEVVSFSPSVLHLEGLEKNKYFDVLITGNIQNVEEIYTSVVTVMVEKEKLYIVGVTSI